MYSQKAFEILNSSINSIIFIDEKAKEVFSSKATDVNIIEEKLSVDLYNTFKENGKSLVVHKFDKSNLEDPKILDYLFNGRDLILLDWELDDIAGFEYSLKLLSRAISTPYISFCCIYSSSTNFESIPLFLDAYFSGLSNDDILNIQNQYSYLDMIEVQSMLNANIDVIQDFLVSNQINVDEISVDKLKNRPVELLIRYIYIALTHEKYIFPNEPIEYSILSNGNDSFIINNTFVFALNKDVNNDINCQKLIERISKAIINNESCFFQLLGLEMQSIFNSNEQFIDETILKSTTEALFQFRNHLKNDKVFATTIKKLLLEQASLKLRTAKLKLLEEEFLEFKGNEIKHKSAKAKDLFQLNVFYNSVSVKGISAESELNLNFGDVFKDSKENYYLCITALCDCYEPSKILWNFYFVKGNVCEEELAMSLGDTAFISFLPNNKAISWGDVESSNPKKITKNVGESDDEYRKRKHQAKIEAYIKFKYKPYYIKPRVYNVQNNKFKNNRIEILEITNKVINGQSNQDLNSIELEYMTTLRSDYAQRIANHAFNHSIRVGVDFANTY